MVRTATTALLLAALAISVGIDSTAQESTPPGGGRDAISDATESDLDALGRLSRGTYSERQRATLEMWRQRDVSRPQVQEAARHPDPEVSGRAKWILRQWRRGSLADTPPEISRLLQRGNGQVAIERLLESGQFTAVMVAVEEADGNGQREAIGQRVAAAMVRRFPMYVHRALETGSLHELLKLVDMTADSSAMAVSRLQLMQQLGMEVETDSLLPTSAVSWSASQRRRATTLVLITLGRIDEALEVAGQVDDDFLHRCRMIASRWQEAAADSVRKARAAEPGSYEHARWWCLTLAAADRAGDQALFEEAAGELTSRDPSEDDPATQLQWKYLASQGEVEAALTILDKVDPAASAAVAVDAARPGRGFDVLGYPLERLDRDLTVWVDEVLEIQRNEPGKVTPEVRRMLALMQSLLAVGRDDAAWYIARRMCQSDVKISSLRLREWVLSTLTMTKRGDWVIRLAVSEQENAITPQTQNSIANTLTGADEFTLEIVLKALVPLMRGQPLSQRVSAAAQLLKGEIPETFDPSNDFRRFYDFVTQPLPIQRLRGQMGRSGMLANLSIVDLLAKHGQSDLATDCLRKLSRSGDLEATFALGEHELDRGRAETAGELFQSIFQSIEGADRGRGGSSDDGLLAVKAWIGLWTVARRCGDGQASDRLEREIRLALCSPSISLRHSVAEYLGERGDADFALEVFQTLLPITVFGDEEQTGLYEVARSYSMLASKTNPGEAARWFDLAIGGSVDVINFRPGAYITLPLYVRRWRIESAIARKDREQAAKHLDRILRLDPLDIDFAERLLPQMREAGMGELADQALQRIMDVGMRYTDDFPFDAMSSNNLAWVAAMNGQRLDDALRLAEMAVYVQPDSAVYRDTLAEVLFQLNRKQEALQIERGCLLDDPGQWHLHQQIEKYSQSIDQQ